MAAFAEYEQYDGLGLAALVREKQITPAELVEAAISRIERHNPRLNAVVRPLYEAARKAAAAPIPDNLAAPFAGVPFLIKDLLSMVAGEPTGSGTRLLQTIPADHDSEIVRRYRASGAIILGKTNTPEFGLTPYTEPEAGQPARNPWDLSRTPGGSSGGSGAAVAARIVPLAGGGDGGGSIRIPAACCGLFGLKPSRGRTPSGPRAGEIWRGFAIEHVLTRSVRDSAAMLDAIAGADIGAPYAAPQQERPFLAEVAAAADPLAGPRLRIAMTTAPLLGGTVHPDCVAATAATARLLENLGHTVIEAAPPIDGEAFAIAFLTILAAETRADIADAARQAGRKPRRADFEASTYALGLLGRSLRAADYASAARELQTAARRIGQFFSQYDALLTPTLAMPPVRIGELQPSRAERIALDAVGRLNAGWLLNALGVVKPLAAKVFAFIPYTPPFNVTGQPAMSVPLYWNAAGLPIGVQFVGRFGDEATLFRLAGQLEQAQPWADRRPSLIKG